MEAQGTTADRHARALDHAARLARNEAVDPGEALASWRFSPDRAVSRRILDLVVSDPPLPAPEQRAPFGEGLDERTASIAWALAELGHIGLEIDRRERQAWRAVAYAESSANDAETTALWLTWFEGAPWTAKRRWEALFLPAVRVVFRAVVAACRLPEKARRRSIADLDEAFFFILLGSKESVPGWLDLAIRVVETAAPGPVDAVAALLPEAGFSKLARCASVTGQWPSAARLLFPVQRVPGRAEPSLPVQTGTRTRPQRPRAQALALSLEQHLRGHALLLEGALDVHVALRLLEVWKRTTAFEASWATVVQNRGRARSRLRALVAATSKDAVLPVLLKLDAIHDRTLRAIRRFAWSWAYRAVRDNFAFDSAGAAPCEDVMTELEPIAKEDSGQVRCWVLLAILKGRLQHLERWVRTGGTGDRDSTWARLLSDELPESLRDRAIEGRRAATYHRLRAELSESLGEHLEALLGWLERIALLERGRDLRASFTALVAPLWEQEVPLPKSGFPTFLDHAERAIEHIRGRQDADAQ